MMMMMMMMPMMLLLMMTHDNIRTGYNSRSSHHRQRRCGRRRLRREARLIPDGCLISSARSAQSWHTMISPNLRHYNFARIRNTDPGQYRRTITWNSVDVD